MWLCCIPRVFKLLLHNRTHIIFATFFNIEHRSGFFILPPSALVTLISDKGLLILLLSVCDPVCFMLRVFAQVYLSRWFGSPFKWRETCRFTFHLFHSVAGLWLVGIVHVNKLWAIHHRTMSSNRKESGFSGLHFIWIIRPVCKWYHERSWGGPRLQPTVRPILCSK